MHIVIFSALYKPSIGGVENYTEQLAKALVRLGHNVTIVTHHIDDSAEWEQSQYATIVRLPCAPLLSGRLPIPLPGSTLSNILKKLGTVPCDAVLINTRFYPLSLLGAEYAEKRGVTPIVLEHGSAHLTLGNKVIDTFINLYEHGITALLKQKKPSFYGVSSASCRWLKHFRIDAAGTLPNAIDVSSWLGQASNRNYRDEYPAASSVPIICFVGRLVPEKGIQALVEAMGILHASDYPTFLLVAGDGPLKERLESLATPNVLFLGPLTKSDVASLMLQSDLYCLPSRSEGFATSLLEASASGTASLITDVGGVAELIPNDSYGWILHSTKPQDIAESIKVALNDRQQLKQQGLAVQHLVKQNFNWQSTAEKLVCAFRGL